MAKSDKEKKVKKAAESEVDVKVEKKKRKLKADADDNQVEEKSKKKKSKKVDDAAADPCTTHAEASGSQYHLSHTCLLFSSSNPLYLQM